MYLDAINYYEGAKLNGVKPPIIFFFFVLAIIIVFVKFPHLLKY